MDDASIVRVGECPGNVFQETDAFADWQNTIAGQPVAKGQSVDELMTTGRPSPRS